MNYNKFYSEKANLKNGTSLKQKNVIIIIINLLCTSKITERYA